MYVVATGQSKKKKKKKNYEDYIFFSTYWLVLQYETRETANKIINNQNLVPITAPLYWCSGL